MAYDSAVTSFTTKTDKVDLVQAAHINSVQSELVTIETILGTNVKGNRSDLKTRLNNALDADGSILSGTAFPSPALTSQLYFRTDLGLLYLFNSAWGVVGGGLSNVIFQWNGCDLGTTNIINWYYGTSLSPNIASSTPNYNYYGVYGNTYRTILNGKFTKISGISTVTIMGRLWANDPDSSREALLKIDIGGQNNYVKSTATITPAWSNTSTIDVSSLTNGTTYDITIQLANEDATIISYCSAVTIIAS